MCQANNDEVTVWHHENYMPPWFHVKSLISPMTQRPSNLRSGTKPGPKPDQVISGTGIEPCEVTDHRTGPKIYEYWIEKSPCLSISAKILEFKLSKGRKVLKIPYAQPKFWSFSISKYQFDTFNCLKHVLPWINSMIWTKAFLHGT